jgi:NAD(P)H-nitrite reductase large subunit
VISYAPQKGVRRELFIVEGKAVGGSLIGDISAAGALRALISARREIVPGDTALLKSRTRGIIHFPERTGRRQALILSA